MERPKSPPAETGYIPYGASLQWNPLEPLKKEAERGTLSWYSSEGHETVT